MNHSDHAARRNAAMIQWILHRRLDTIVPHTLAAFAATNAGAMTIYHVALWWAR